MTRVSEEQPQDMFSLFLRHTSRGLSVMNLLQEIRDELC